QPQSVLEQLVQPFHRLVFHNLQRVISLGPGEECIRCCCAPTIGAESLNMSLRDSGTKLYFEVTRRAFGFETLSSNEAIHIDWDGDLHLVFLSSQSPGAVGTAFTEHRINHPWISEA